jgi:hypothetical protein
LGIYSIHRYLKLSISLRKEVTYMPAFDGTGPRGLGPMTGRGLGPCGLGMRRGGFRRFVSPRNELAALEEEEKMLEEELAMIREERSALKGQKK